MRRAAVEGGKRAVLAGPIARVDDRRMHRAQLWAAILDEGDVDGELTLTLDELLGAVDPRPRE
jgi:hypothetical protein